MNTVEDVAPLHGIPILHSAKVGTPPPAPRRLSLYARWPYQSGALFRRLSNRLVNDTSSRDFNGTILWVAGLEGGPDPVPWAVALADQFAHGGLRAFVIGDTILRGNPGTSTRVPAGIATRLHSYLPNRPWCGDSDLEQVCVLQSGPGATFLDVDENPPPWIAFYAGQLPRSLDIAPELTGIVLVMGEQPDSGTLISKIRTAQLPILGRISVDQSSAHRSTRARNSQPTVPQLRLELPAVKNVTPEIPAPAELPTRDIEPARRVAVETPESPIEVPTPVREPNSELATSGDSRKKQEAASVPETDCKSAQEPVFAPEQEIGRDRNSDSETIELREPAIPEPSAPDPEMEASPKSLVDEFEQVPETNYPLSPEDFEKAVPPDSPAAEPDPRRRQGRSSHRTRLLAVAVSIVAVLIVFILYSDRRFFGGEPGTPARSETQSSGGSNLSRTTADEANTISPPASDTESDRVPPLNNTPAALPTSAALTTSPTPEEGRSKPKRIRTPVLDTASHSALDTSNAGKQTSPPSAASCAIQLGSYRLDREATAELRRLTARGISARKLHTEVPGKGEWFRIVVGEYTNLQLARTAAIEFQESTGIDVDFIALRGGQGTLIPVVPS